MIRHLNIIYRRVVHMQYLYSFFKSNNLLRKLMYELRKYFVQKRNRILDVPFFIQKPYQKKGERNWGQG